MPNPFHCKDGLPAFQTDDAKRVADAFGLMPRAALTAMVDYGLNDEELSKYYSLPIALITSLREHFGICDAR